MRQVTTYTMVTMKRTPSTVVSLRLPHDSAQRLRTVARRHGWTASEAGARLVEEGLRRQEFAFIDFRDSHAGRQACIQASTLAVWEVILLLRSHQGNLSHVAEHLRWPEVKVRAAVLYAAAYPEEISAALEESHPPLEALQRLLPQLQVFTVGKANPLAKRLNVEAAAR